MTLRLVLPLILLLLTGGWGAYKIHTNEIAILELTNSLATTQTKLDAAEANVIAMSKTYALSKDLQDLKESMSVVVASATVLINDNTQVNINTLNDVKRSIENEEDGITSSNSLHPTVVSWLQRYERNR